MNKKLILGVAPTRRGWFTNSKVMENRDAINKAAHELCDESDAEFVGIEGLSSDGTMSELSDADRIIERFRKKNVNALFIPHVNFGQEETVLKLAKALMVPTLIWGERDGCPNGLSERLTDTQCGLFATGKVLYRCNIPFTYIENSYLSDKVFQDGFRNFLAAARIVINLKNVRIGQISVRPQPFLSVMINESELMERFGIELVPIHASYITENAKKLASSINVQHILNDYQSAGIDLSSMSKEARHNMAGLELSIRNFAEENSCSAVVSECWNIYRESLCIRPCAAFGNLSDSGLPIACENDVHGAISMLIAQACNNGNEPIFLADLTQRHPSNDNAELLWHCGPFPKSLKGQEGKPFINDGTGNWRLKDGPLTLIRFDGCHGVYNLFSGEAKTCEGPITNGNYVWSEVTNWPNWEQKLVTGPYIHHVACVYGKYVNAIKEACKYIPVSFDEP